MDIVIAFTTIEPQQAARLARALVTEGLAACVTVMPHISSTFVWRSEIQTETESLLMIKTTAETVERLEKRLVELHPYEVPEFFTLSPQQVHQPYLQWVTASVGALTDSSATDSPPRKLRD